MNKTELHWTKCDSCNRVIALSDSEDLKCRLVAGVELYHQIGEDNRTGYRNHMNKCAWKYGDYPKISRVKIRIR